MLGGFRQLLTLLQLFNRCGISSIFVRIDNSWSLHVLLLQNLTEKSFRSFGISLSGQQKVEGIAFRIDSSSQISVLAFDL